METTYEVHNIDADLVATVTDNPIVATTSDKKRKKKRFKKGTASLREIAKFQKTTELLFPKIAFKRVVQDITRDIVPHTVIRYSSNGVLALQEACEAFITNKLRRANNYSIRNGRKTILKRDLTYDDEME